MAHIAMPAAMPAATQPDATNGGVNVPLERRCDNPDCTVYKMVTNVPKRKTPQFVTEPVVMEKPLLINGFTTIFQVEGQSAKLSDIKAPNPQKPLYRIVPNTHAHIVNYVVVDSDAESLRKINENDPATMRKLLDSQKQSADQMLKKLIAGHSMPMANVNAANIAAAPTSMATTPTMTNVTPITAVGGNIGSITPISVAKLMPKTATSTIQLQRHPNLKITAVASAEGLANIASGSINKLMNAPASNPVVTVPPTAQQLPIQLQQPTQQSTMPLITPVPLANLQRASAAPTAQIAPHTSVMSSNIGRPTMSTISAPSSAIGDIVEKPVFDKMQQELQELRRTVALLAEAQAKSKQN